MNNLITIDIGNSNVDLGLFKNEDLVYNAKVSTQDNKSEFEIATSIKQLLNLSDDEAKWNQFVEGLEFEDVLSELESRFGTSGYEEKSSR